MDCTEENNNIIMCSSAIVARLIYADVLPEKAFFRPTPFPVITICVVKHMHH